MNNRRMIWTVSALALTAIAVLAVVMLRRGGQSEAEPEPEPLVEVTVARPAGVIDTLVFSAQGRVVARTSFAVTALSEGKIGRMYVSVGQPVEKGQPVARLENTELDRELELQKEKLELSHATVEALDRKVEDAAEMLRLGIISENDNVAIKQELNNQKAQARDQQITSGRLEGRERNYVVTAGSSGYVAEVLAEQSFVTYGQTVARIVSPQDEQVEAYVPYGALEQPQPGQLVTISCNGRSVAGRVSHSYPSADANQLRVIIRPEEPTPLNLEVTVTFHLRTAKGLLIPKSAVVLDEDKPAVFVVRNNVAYRKYITVEKDYLDRVVIAGGLGPDEELVTGNAYLLSDAMNVRVK
ncbi:efflux RND transporter periplasmic adaptor subunit [bacterium]|nr:efflux RND transporter periplasmic adaptor subunit [bacterium]